MSRKDRPSRRRPAKRPRTPSQSGRTSSSGAGWHTYRLADFLVYVNPNVTQVVANQALDELLAEHGTAASSDHALTFEIASGMYATAHRFRGADWFVVTDTRLRKIYIGTADVFAARFGWQLGTNRRF